MSSRQRAPVLAASAVQVASHAERSRKSRWSKTTCPRSTHIRTSARGDDCSGAGGGTDGGSGGSGGSGRARGGAGGGTGGGAGGAQARWRWRSWRWRSWRWRWRWCWRWRSSARRRHAPSRRRRRQAAEPIFTTFTKVMSEPCCCRQNANTGPKVLVLLSELTLAAKNSTSSTRTNLGSTRNRMQAYKTQASASLDHEERALMKGSSQTSTLARCSWRRAHDDISLSVLASLLATVRPAVSGPA
eukprot:scaffold20147_cov63-Phaeocystis_antarctica.AAC.2